ncbi:MAG: zeta toxin family protein [Gammaproteobacteria bacterium]|nr:zeta toxin family protein [Gammaproteobacteria bacterium]MCW8839889.1 zeta toxin family protein [Gammaproteobacteria bacterium]MCW8958931.1 zeta toxin family protein [Gammaproteobacteria bacterium]MCW8992395.1 zeta toxin family protein [Gammaproteobacteria bacterium]
MHELPDEERRLLVVIAGHNGAGKTTIYRERFKGALAAFLATHINPDEVEQTITLDLGENNHTKREFAILAAEESTRLRHQYLEQDTSFSFETVLSDPAQDKVGFMDEARHRGYLVVLIAVGLDSIELSKARVAIRHAKGGHNVPEDKVEGRYERVLQNFAHGARVATLAIFLDNSEDRSEDNMDTYWDIAFFENGELVFKDESPPAWWHQVESTLDKLNAGSE